MAPIGSKDLMDWLPGLGSSIHDGSESLSAPRVALETGVITQAGKSNVDEVQYSIVCDGCGKHFWSRSKADSHAALTAHVLCEEMASPCPSVTDSNLPAAITASAAATNPFAKSGTEADASPNSDTSDQEDGDDSREKEDSVIPASPAVNRNINSRSLHWITGPGTAAIAANRDMNPTSLCWTTERTTDHEISPTSPGYDGGMNPTSTHGMTRPTRGHATALFRRLNARSPMPYPGPQASRIESDHYLRRSSGASPSPSLSGLPLKRDLPCFVKGTQTVLTPTATASPSPSSSCATLEQPQVIFPCELSDRIFFIVTPSGERKGPGFIMGLAEAQNPVTFRTGVRTRLESQGEHVGFREIIAHIPWLPVPVYSDTDEDHYHMLMVVRSWPEWRKTSGKASCHILVTLEDEKEDIAQGEN